jgi:hypothetical protein
MSAYDRYAMLDVYVTPPRQNVAAGTNNQRVMAVTTASAVKKLQDDILVAVGTAPSGQPAARQGELPGSGPVLVRFQATGGDVYIVFNPTNAAVVDATNATAADFGDRIPQDQYVDYLLTPGVDNYFAAATATGTATLKYRLSSPPANNRP